VLSNGWRSLHLQSQATGKTFSEFLKDSACTVRLAVCMSTESKRPAEIDIDGYKPTFVCGLATLRSNQMKTWNKTEKKRTAWGHAVSIALLASGLCARAAIVVPGANGSDGALVITNDTVIDLSQAAANAWNSDNSAYAGKGVYDSNQWAVVFKYTDVSIASNKTVTFKNHPSRAPVVWLVSGNVTIGGTISLNGQDYVTPPTLAEPGPGGFRGGTGYFMSSVTAGSGFGIGGANQDGTYGSGGSYGTVGSGANIATTYGNPSLIPLIGGSGGSGSTQNNKFSGGGGGGAMLIACQGMINIMGSISAVGGFGINVIGTIGANFSLSGSGSGGGIRLVSDTLSGTGVMSAAGGAGSGYQGYRVGGVGRIRLERVSNNNSIIVTPAPSTVDLAPGSTALIWPPTNSPSVSIVSIGGLSAPADPRAAFGTYGADVALPVTTQATVVVRTVNVEQASQVQVRITPRDTYNATNVTAVYSSTSSTNPLTILWNATVPANLGYSAVQVHVIRP
jgi:hypothetical protein